MARQSKFPGGKAPLPNNNGFGGQRQNKGSRQSSPFANSKPLAKQPNGLAAEAPIKSQPGGRNKKPERQERYQPAPRVNGNKAGPTREPSERTKQLSTFAFNYANNLYSHLKKEKINPPQPLAEAGDPSKRAAIDSLKETYKKYRTRVYTSLRKADLIDDPEKRRKLEDALPFKGICEDMCPEFEQVARIAEYDVRTEEKEMRPDGLTMWPDTSRMVKKFGRSAAGQDAPLPMDVRSVDALRRTTDYLFNDLLQSDSNLPSMHNFLWDRTRAVRKDFTFHSQKSAEEMKDMVYCFETITRFHATALHLLSRKGFANDDFDQKQEIEQLGRTILSLMEAYDMCRDKRVQCENEAEFRAYYLLLNAGDPAITKRIPTWGKEYWFESEEVQTALSLIQVMDDVREPKGPIKPRRPTTLSDMSFANYFAIVEELRVSYPMACVAEIHFTTVRQAILRNLVKGYARYRDAPRTITASDLNAMLKFDTVEEAVEFAELHDFEFSTWVPEGKPPVPEPYLLLDNRKKYVPSPRVRQSFSGKLVERKRTTQSLPYVIYNTIFEEPTEKPPSAEDSHDSLFVSQTSPFENATSAPSSTFMQSAAPPTTATTPSPFGFAAKAPGIPSTGGLTGAAVPPFTGFQPSQPLSSTISSPFGAPSQPPAQAQPTTSPFSFLGQPPAPSANSTSFAQPSSVLGQPAQPQQTTASPLTTSKPSENSSTFSFLKNFSSPQAPSVPQTQPSTPSFPSTPSLLGSTSTSNPIASFAPSQDASSTQAKPAEPAPSFAKLGSAPLGSTSPFPPTAFAKPTEPQPTPAAPAVPSISITPPSLLGRPTTQGAQPTLPAPATEIPKQSPLPSAPIAQTSSPFAPSRPAAVPPKPRQTPKRDLMGDFAKWFVKGDGGLMEQFTESALHNILWGAFQNFQRQEAEQKRREEDEESWRLAREHQAHRLQVKYFYRWRNAARSLATKRILRSGKEKMRLHREQQRAIQKQQQEEREKAEREARRAHKRQLLEDGHRLSLLASSSRRRPSIAYSVDHNPEEQLLASGVFAGLRDDPRSVARRVVRDAVANGDNWGSVTTSRSFHYPYPESELELEPARDSADDTSSVGGKREGWKTRSLREKFGIGEPQLRRSLSASGNNSAIINSFSSSFSSSSRLLRQSLPGGNRNTNFSTTPARKRFAEEESDDEPDAKRQTAKTGGLAKSRHWDLRARGFVPTPEGGWVPEGMMASPSRLMPDQSQGGHDEREFVNGDIDGDADADADAVSEAGSATDLRARLARLKQARVQPHQHHRGHGARHSVDLPTGFVSSVSQSYPPPFAPPARPVGREEGSGGKRKRGADVDGIDAEAEEREVSPGAKKPNVGAVVQGREETSAMVENTRRMLRELREFMDRLDGGEGQERGEVLLQG